MTNSPLKKRKFGIPDTLSKGLSNTIKMAEGHVGTFKNVLLPLSCVSLDPDNPRRLALSLNEVKQDQLIKDEHYQQKLNEKEALSELAWSIKHKGLINPITVYQQGDDYRLVAGERRYLASVMVGKQDIEARVYKIKPNAQELKLVQWIENTARADLTLMDKLANIRAIVHHIMQDGQTKKVSAEMLMQTTGLAQANAYRYLAILNNTVLMQFIEQQQITAFKTASLLAGIKQANQLKSILQLMDDGLAVNQAIKQVKAGHASTANKSAKNNSEQLEQRGRVATSINLGKVSQPKVVKLLVDSVLANPHFHQLKPMFASVDWSNTKEASQLFKKLLTRLAQEV